MLTLLKGLYPGPCDTKELVILQKPLRCAAKWGVVQRILWAWALTLPITALLGYLLVRLGALLGR